MNRYRTAPGLGPQKATVSTTCQKCLRKGHYSYECKASLAERPYASRPSRSQQFNDPKLAPKLSSTKPNELLETKGVADRILADAEAKRDEVARRSSSPKPSRSSPAKRRSRSASSGHSVSTISTNKSRSPSPDQQGRERRGKRRNSRQRSGSVSRTRGRKRRYDSLSSASSSRSPSPHRRSRPKNRRHRLDSPDDRGRPVPRRGSHRSPSRSPSLDKSQVTRHRRSLESRDDDPRSLQRKENVRPSRENVRGKDQPRSDRRSLSPYSRRLALTQAMNMSR